MTLQDFYDLMAATAQARRRLVPLLLEKQGADGDDIALLEHTLAQLQALPGVPGKVVLELGAGGIVSNLSYEIEELEKDLLFVRQGRAALREYMLARHENMDEQLERCRGRLSESPPNLFITDRDGTINNYCGRYRSSIQSAYNAVFMAQFLRTHAVRGVILTSAPLMDGGLLDVNVLPQELMVFAGSKGREYLGGHGERILYEMSPAESIVVERLNEALEKCLQQARYQEFALIGSGFQKKFGQSTVARQDANGSVDDARSREFLDDVRALVKRVDPGGEHLHLEDTGLDIEIMLTSREASPSARAFDKGDGLMFLNDRLGLEQPAGPVLVCGDTPADVPMLEAARRIRKAVTAIFVTQDPDLQAAVRAIDEDALFVDSPDVLVTALAAAAVKS